MAVEVIAPPLVMRSEIKWRLASNWEPTFASNAAKLARNPPVMLAIWWLRDIRMLVHFSFITSQIGNFQ
jgi:hypothetical protein